jgi:hypoxanthine phosphoribosyltransferase
MTWEACIADIQKLKNQFDVEFDIIVGVARGGTIPSALLAKMLNIKDTVSLKVHRENKNRWMFGDINEDITGKKILLVEDALETGNSLLFAKEYLENKGALVKSACLYKLPDTIIDPDYCLETVETIPTFPWNII